MLQRLEPVVWTALALVAVYAVHMLRRWRWMRLEQFADFPQLSAPSLLWGHMGTLADMFKKGDPRRHLDQVLLEACRAQGNPPVLLLDLRPFMYPMLVICNCDVAEQITHSSARWSSSTPKSPTLDEIEHLTGKTSILTAEGDHWKEQRRRLSPGFAPQHLLATAVPVILDKARLFTAHLDRLASADAFALDEFLTALTFDVIGAVAFGLDFDAQIPGRQTELLRLFVDMAASFAGRRSHALPLVNWPGDLYRARLARRIERVTQDLVRQEHARVVAAAATATPASSRRSVLALSLQDTAELTPELLQQTSDNLRVFLFAGHDTTSILLQWALYELSRSPRQRAALVAELDALLGRDTAPAAVEARLRDAPDLLGRMAYTAAVVKETLRLHPPAASVRMAPPGTGLMLDLGGGGAAPRQTVCADGTVMYINATLIQRDRGVWGASADDFVPERWLAGGGGDDMATRGAWRPFERGPRACIGLELAYIEAKIVLALVVRRYDFVKVGVGELVRDAAGRPVLDDKGYCRTKSALFNSAKVTAKPVDRMMVKVRIRQEE